ncbi:Gfo/Idh/MocA family oxidoreductase [Actomonas aquatica]|uniref:Gfo/Idh/MocA family oxidoreductase n=1 Tax=Actomonas aquatica TaxID=2866162 RepID=A0ABZ1C8E3_9BACT|nr:Gfo/Idh/MocA family oxidoreductase [Opitutus sp. WL0086]WRQ87844.1 Gfo/Idh/MocA family oxidoreductase [Opitutus sp. WL0086]
MNAPINIGVVGLGRLGRIYAGHFASRIHHARLVAVTDVQADVTAAVAAETGARACPDFESLVTHPEVDAVVVVTPTRYHHPVVLAAAAAGKAIFCEKPLSLDLAEGEAMRAAVNQHGIFFHLAFMRRFDPGYAAAQRAIATGRIGAPLVFKSSSRDRNPPPLDYLRPENSGGLFIDMGIHDFDLARWFMGDVQSVHSTGGALADPAVAEVGDVDNAFTSLVFASGMLGQVNLSRNGVYGYAIDTEIVGRDGTLRVGYDRETPLQIMSAGHIGHDTVPGFLERFAQAYLIQLQDFVDRLRAGDAPAITCEDGIAAQRIASAATRSLHEDRRITLDQD